MLPAILTFKPRKRSSSPSSDTDTSATETLLPTTSSNASTTSLTIKPYPTPASHQTQQQQQPTRNHDLRTAARAVLISTSVYVTVGLFVVYSLRGATFLPEGAEDAYCMRRVSQYSPLLPSIPQSLETISFNGTFLHENIYRGPAGPEVDAAWEALGVNYRGVAIPESEAEKTGLRRDQVKISKEYGGGYPANVEGLHHLHCLNLLRKTLKWNYDYYLAKKEGPFVNSEYIVRIHTTHCLDILRQQLMCVTDVGVLGQVWWQPEGSPPLPFVDFNTKHKCRDYEAIRKWAEEHQLPPESEVDMSKFYEMPKPEDTILPEIP